MGIPRHVRQLLAELELISHGSTQSWNSAGGHGDSEQALPYGESNPPHLWLRALYLEHRSLWVVTLMRDALREAHGQVDRSHVVGETREQEDNRILQTKGTADEVALRFNCTKTRVRRLRLAKGHDEMGYKVEVGLPDVELLPAAEAVRMAGNGMSERQIAFALGEHRTTVTRWLKRAA